MPTHNRERDFGNRLALAALVATACVAGIPPIVDTVAQSFEQSKVNAARAALACTVCGVVEEVREVTLGTFKHKVSTVSGDGFAMLLGLLSGKLGTGPVQIYEIAVRLEDGSMRVFQEGTLPVWKPGDRVKVAMGRIKPRDGGVAQVLGSLREAD